MPIMNYTAQDLIGVFTGFLLFSLIVITPGYTIGYILDIFDFKKRQPFVRLGIGLLLSCAISPILFFLTYRFVSNIFTIIIIFGFTVAFVLIFFREGNPRSILKGIAKNRFIKVMLAIAFLWVILGALLLVDIQWGNRLYFNLVAYDYSTRTAVVNAITRSGVPPINPGYFPGEPVRLTFLYYFWYILCSLVDQLGGKVVDSRASMMASALWAGLGLMVAVALYIRSRNSPAGQNNPWRPALIGIGLLAVSGLDILGSTFYILFPQYLVGYTIFGDIEHWNEQITAWIGTTLWTPHHLVALLNGVLAWLLVLYHHDKRTTQKFFSAVIAGLAFASALGLSTWVTLIFVLFWIFLIISRLLNGEPVRNLWDFFLPGLLAAIVVLPFLLDLYGGGGDAAAVSPLAFDIRSFRPAVFFMAGLPYWQKMLVNFSLLPLNYFLELGFFFLAGIYWYRHCGKGQLEKNPFMKSEIILLITSAFLATFARSILIANNDFGWRGWLPGQFVLLVWGTDIVLYFWIQKSNLDILVFRSTHSMRWTRNLLSILLIFGVLTSLQDILLLRSWPVLLDTGLFRPPSSETYSGERVLEAREVYHRIDNLTLETAIVQSEPSTGIDRASGLYGTRNAVISSLTLYGVPKDLFEPMFRQVSSIFNTGQATWQRLDEACQKYSIDVLIIKSTNPLWKSLDQLKSARQPLYSGSYYAAFLCGRSRDGVTSQVTSPK